MANSETTSALHYRSAPFPNRPVNPPDRKSRDQMFCPKKKPAGYAGGLVIIASSLLA
jgi:hypothetical protein